MIPFCVVDVTYPVMNTVSTCFCVCVGCTLVILVLV